MKIEKYYNTSYIPQKYISSLIDAEIECWGSEPFWEFLKCRNPKCWQNYSIEDVYWNIQTYIENKNKKIFFICQKCNWLTQNIYKKEEFTKLAIQYIKQKVNLILLINNNNIRWFWVITRTNLINLINIEFNTRKQSYNKRKLLSTISEDIFDVKNASKNDLLCFHQLFIWEELRGKWLWNKLTKEILGLKKETNNLPIFLETKKESIFFHTAKKLWFNELTKDKYWYIIMCKK